MTAERLHLVRHAQSQITPDTPAREWNLAPEASMSDLRSAGVLPERASWFSSPEPKARQSAALITSDQIEVLPALAEVGREGTLLSAEEFTAAVRGYLTDGHGPGAAVWEPRVDATLRIVDGALAAMEHSTEPACVLVGHGTAFTLLVAALVGAPPDAEAWATMAMPDHCELAIGPGGRFEVVSGWGAWTQLVS